MSQPLRARRGLARASLVAASGFVAAQAAATPDAGAPPSAGTSSLTARAPSACVEHVPEGKPRPELMESFPDRGKAGYAAVLEIKIPHGLGESVLPGGFKVQLDSPEGRALSSAHFVIPDVSGPAGPRLRTSELDGRALTTVELSFVPLPEEPGRHELTLPSVPIAIARASGELLTVCTQPHDIVVDDPTSNVAHAKPRRNPPPLRQLEVWTTAKNVALAALTALPLGALLAFLIGRFLRRERPGPPPPPPRPPWDVALEALGRVRDSDLIAKGATTEHFVEVTLAVRRYLGDRYGFDGLECTTREILAQLARARPSEGVEAEVKQLLERADLVKFANLTPEAAECEVAFERSERIVRQTMPSSLSAPEEAAPRPPGGAA
jgi:hypothetical protein